MSTALTSWLPYVEPDVPAPQPMIVRAVRDAIIRLCEESYYWQEDLAAILG